MFRKTRRTATTIQILVGVVLCLSGCGGYGTTYDTSSQEVMDTAVTGMSVSQAVSGEAVTEKVSGNSAENEEQITVGSDKVALRQGDAKDSTLVIRMRDGREEILATFDISVKDCHIEPFKGILGYDGFRFFVKGEYETEVYYVGLADDKAKVLFENHAEYEKKTGKYTADYEEEIKDFDGDGVREVISNISYHGDGGAGAVVYDCEEGQVYVGYLLDLFDLKEDEYYVGRATDIRSWYDSELKKVRIEYRKNKKDHKGSQKLYDFDLSKIEMERDYTIYDSDELKDLWKYEEMEEE